MEEEDERTNSNADDHLLSEVRGDFLGLRWTPLPATPARRRRSEGRVVQHRPQKSARTSESVIKKSKSVNHWGRLDKVSWGSGKLQTTSSAEAG